MLLNNSDNVVIDEALVLHQAQPPKIPSLHRIQDSAAARSSSFSPRFAAYLAGIVWPRGPWRKKPATHQVEFSTWQVKDLKCANAKVKGKVVPQQQL